MFKPLSSQETLTKTSIMYLLIGQETFTKIFLLVLGHKIVQKGWGTMKNLCSSFLMLLLILLFCANLPFVGLVHANFLPPPVPEHSFEITSNGVVNGTSTIERTGNVYTFTEDLVGSLVISCDDIVVDGAGFSLQATGEKAGLWLQAINNVTLKNLVISNFTHGIVLTHGFGGGCTNITVSGNTVTNNQYGLALWMFSNSNYFLGNVFSNNTYGICVEYSPNNVFRNNQMTQNQYNFCVTADLSSGMAEFVNDIDDSNTVDGKPVIYWVNEHNKAVPSDAGYVGLINCTNITVQNLVLTKNGQGVLLVGTNNCTIKENYLGNNEFGVLFQGSFANCFDNTITKNNITANTEDGIFSWGSFNTSITANSITNNHADAIHFYDSTNAYIVGNAVSGNINIDHPSLNTVYNNDAEIPDDEIPDMVPEFSTWVAVLLTASILAGIILVYNRRITYNAEKN